LSRCLTITDFSDAAWYLGLKIEHSKGIVRLSQSAFLQRVVEAADPGSKKICKVPVDEGVKLVNNQVQASKDDIKDYQAGVGGAMYLMTQTRPDIAYAIGRLARYASNPAKQH
ncbi:hypothetical protein BO99DRAFT_290957, partial [Aspergillus violaceofuscus CBS 115571]